MCQKQNKCTICDAEIHEVSIVRKKKTYLQISRYKNIKAIESLQSTSENAPELSRFKSGDVLQGRDYEQMPREEQVRAERDG